jgi:F-type H+-transporting ATPase subunit delta
MREERIAHRYARALISAVKDDALLPRIEADLQELSSLFADEASGLRLLLENPVFRVSERQSVLKQMGERMSLHPMTNQFLSLLVEKDRARLLPALSWAFGQELDSRLARVRAVITTAQPLIDGDLAQIVGALNLRLGKNVVSKTEVDPSVLGGVRAQIGGLVFDGTLETKLASLRRALVSSSLSV